MLAWGRMVSTTFLTSVLQICNRLSIKDPSWLMSCIAFETGETFSPKIKNAAGSGAVGLIQFMPSTAASLGTSTEALAAMSAEDQLAFVELYFHRWAGRMSSLGDVYGVILWPGMVGKPDDFVVFREADPFHPKYYIQNKGLDFNKDGTITKKEIVSLIQKKLDKGMALASPIPQGVAMV